LDKLKGKLTLRKSPKTLELRLLQNLLLSGG